jgi:hypothetical protein
MNFQPTKAHLNICFFIFLPVHLMTTPSVPIKESSEECLGNQHNQEKDIDTPYETCIVAVNKSK